MTRLGRFQPPGPPGRTWRDDMFEAQARFVRDSAHRKAAVTSRRAGKTNAIDYWLIEGGLDSPGMVSVFISTSVAHSERTCGLAMERIARDHPELGLVRRHIEGALCWCLPNGHRIWLAGCKNKAEAEKFRGVSTGIRRAAVDEAGSYGPWLEDLVIDVLEPALHDANGEVALTGTPPPVPSGYFYQVTTGDGRPQWSTHHWTSVDNPHLRDPQAYLRRVLEDNGWTEDHPRFQREYLGRWVMDAGSLVFPFDAARNGYRELPPGEYEHATGMDFGVVDSTAWVAGSYVRGLPTLWLRESRAESDLSPTTVAVRTIQWHERWPGRIVGDSGGIGKAFIKEMQERCALPVVPAQKHEKRVALEFLRGDILAGTVKVDLHGCESLLDEATRIQWNEKHTDIDSRCIDHECHAALYLHRDTRLAYRPEREPPTPGTYAAGVAEMRAIKERRAAEIAKKLRRRGLRGLA